MSRQQRNAIALFFGIVLGGGLWAAANYPHDICQEGVGTKEEHCEISTVAAYFGFESRAFFERNSSAIQAFSGLMSAFFACVLLFVSNRQARLTEAANRTAEKTAQAAIDGIRPWVKLSVEESAQLIRAESQFTIKIKLGNLGESPAFNVCIGASCEAIDRGADEIATVNAMALLKQSAAQFLDTEMSLSIFQGDAPETSKVVGWPAWDSEKPFRVLMAVHIRYEYTGGRAYVSACYSLKEHGGWQKVPSFGEIRNSDRYFTAGDSTKDLRIVVSRIPLSEVFT